MALIVEDGTVVANAESYASVSDADAYCANRGITAWAGYSTAQKEQRLRRATDYMIEMYRQRWKGVRYNASQLLDWPRAYVFLSPALTGPPYPADSVPYSVPNNIVPELVKRACIELALRVKLTEVSGGLLPDQTGPQVLSETVGPISTTYAPYAKQEPQYSSIDAMLAEFLTGNSFNVPLVRV